MGGSSSLQVHPSEMYDTPTTAASKGKGHSKAHENKSNASTAGTDETYVSVLRMNQALLNGVIHPLTLDYKRRQMKLLYADLFHGTRKTRVRSCDVYIYQPGLMGDAFLPQYIFISLVVLFYGLAAGEVFFLTFTRIYQIDESECSHNQRSCLRFV